MSTPMKVVPGDIIESPHGPARVLDAIRLDSYEIYACTDEFSFTFCSEDPVVLEERGWRR